MGSTSKQLTPMHPINPYRVIAELNAMVDKNRTIITHEAGSPRDQMTPFWQSTARRSAISGGARPPSLVTASAILREWEQEARQAGPPLYQRLGGAAIGFTGMDLETAARERIPILSILLNNSSMAIEIPVMPVSQLKYGSTDISGNYADMARAFGCYAERITDPGEITAALKRGIDATETGQPVLLEFITDKEITTSLE